MPEVQTIADSTLERRSFISETSFVRVAIRSWASKSCFVMMLVSLTKFSFVSFLKSFKVYVFSFKIDVFSFKVDVFSFKIDVL